MLTPQDIHDKSFTKSFKGYDMDEVDIFLDQVIEDYDKLTRENKELQSKIETLNAQIESYRGMENSLMHTMVTAHKAAEDITLASKKEADEILANARVQSEQIVNAAKQQARSVQEAQRQEMQETQKKVEMLRGLLDEFKEGVKSYADELIGIVDNMDNPVADARLEQAQVEVEEAPAAFETPAEPVTVEEVAEEMPNIETAEEQELTKAIPGQRSFFKEEYEPIDMGEELVSTVEEEWTEGRKRRR